MEQEKIGKFIKELRISNNMTQQDLADTLEITDKAVSKWENGRCLPDVYFLSKLSKLFNVTEEEILNGERFFKKKDITRNSESLVLDLEDVSKGFGNKMVLRDISFKVYEGEITSLIGPNGAGKTTLIKTILSMYKMDSGKISVCGFNIKKDFEKALTKIGSIVESPSLYDNLTGMQNIKIIMLLNSVKDYSYVNEVIKYMHLEKRINDKVKKYSLGMKQRLAIICALIKKPKLLILDEPTNGLDPNGIKDLRTLLKKLSSEKMSILISSHILKELEDISDKIIIINKGKIEKEFGIEEVKYKNIRLEDEYFKVVGEENENN